MKQPISIFYAGFAILSLTVFGYMKWKDAQPTIDANPILQEVSCNPIGIPDYLSSSTPVDLDFVYSIDSRFVNTITKEDLDKAQSVIDIIPTNDGKIIESYHNIQLSTFYENDKKQIKKKSQDDVLNKAQIQLLRSMNCTSSFYITGNIKKVYKEGERLVDDTLVYYMTVVPDQPTVYKKGKGALITYLKENSKEAIAIAQKDHLKPRKVSFIVTKDGTIGHVTLTDTSGYHSIDEKMLELIQEMSGNWEPATNAKGENVDQELTFFFGLMGC